MTKAEAIAAAERFLKDLKAVAEDRFSGGALMLPPEQGEATSSVIASSRVSLPAYWAHVNGIVAVEVATAEAHERELSGGARPGRRY